MATDRTLFPDASHDHAICRAAAVAHAERLCAREAARLTPNRRLVLERLLADHRPLSAYEIAERIDWQARRGGPVQVYRALQFLEGLGLVHRIESLNAYIACGQPDSNPQGRPRGDHGAQFLVCQDCGRVAEANDRQVGKVIGALARRAGFEVQAPVIEVRGLCPDCRET